mgnify:CR=1 FL=1
MQKYSAYGNENLNEFFIQIQPKRQPEKPENQEKLITHTSLLSFIIIIIILRFKPKIYFTIFWIHIECKKINPVLSL